MSAGEQPRGFFEVSEGTFGHSLGIVIREASKDRVVGDLRIRDGLRTSWGALHGGAIMTLTDTVTANAAFLNLIDGATTATIESKTNFFAPVRDGIVTAESVPLHRGRRTMVWQTRVTDESGRLVAMTLQTQIVMPGDG
jgi:uncharacterized protein (TIGR00369 family)